jgi:hypothetical protein
MRQAFAVAGFAALLTVGAAPVRAQLNCAGYTATLETLRDAHSSVVGVRNLARSIIDNDTTNIPGQILMSDCANENPEEDYLGQIRRALGYAYTCNSIPATAVYNHFNQSILGNMATHRTTLTALSYRPPVDTTFPFSNFSIRDTSCTFFGCTYPELGDAMTKLQFMIAGDEKVALRTLILFLEDQRAVADGNPTTFEYNNTLLGPTQVIERLFAGFGYIVLQTLVTVLGDGDADAFEIADYNKAIADLWLVINENNAAVLENLDYIVDEVYANPGIVSTPGACWISSIGDIVANPPPPGTDPPVPPSPEPPPVYPPGTPPPPPFTGSDPPPGPTTGCANTGAVLTGSFGMNPCSWTRNNMNLDFAQDHQAGWYLMDHVQKWWNNEMLPSMKSMTAQLNAGVIDQNRQIGSMLDTQSMSNTNALVQQKEYEATKNMAPADRTCVAATPMGGSSQSIKLANSLAQGYRNEVSGRSAGAPGTTAERGWAADQKARIDTYCNVFNDPKVNAGETPCPSPGTPGALPNADVDIENFLLKDTIDLRDPNQAAAASAILTNIVQPRVKDRLPDDAVNTPQGQEWILQNEHIRSIRNIATDVVASMISRRAAIPNATVGTNIRDLRERIGIDPSRISNTPSYQEIMQAMTKERFMDPDYYATMAGSLGQARQEQTMVNAYIVLQMQDVYKLQEQINALLAARAAMKLNADAQPNRVEAGSAR